MLSYVLDENLLEEGFYNLSAKVSMISDYGNLIDTTVGKGVIAQADTYGAAVQVWQDFVSASGALKALLHAGPILLAT